MAIFDILEEVSEKNIVKSESGDPRIFGILVGEVTDNYSLTMPGRVCVSIHVRDSEHNVLKWARVAQPSSGSEWGHYFLPEVGDQVLVVFDQGIIDKPYIIGCIPKDNDKFLKDSKHSKNIYKKIQTKHGSTILFTDGTEMPGEDDSTEDGSNDKISIFTPDKAHEVTLDNAGHSITIKDKENNAGISMNTMDGKIEITAASKLTINVGESVAVVMNGTSGKISVQANSISVESQGTLSLNGTGRATLTGATVDVSAQGAAKLSATGIVSVQGKPIKIG